MPSTGLPLIDAFLALLAGPLGYLIVFGITIFENLLIIGSFTPGETVVIAAAFVAANNELALRYVWITSVLGTIIGSNISYSIGRRAGMDAVRRPVLRIADTRLGRMLKISDEGLEDVQEHFDEQGVKTVLISRFAIGAKNMVPAVAGATKMPVFWFELYTVIGAVLYTSMMCAIGWFLGENIDAAVRVASAIGYVGLGILILFVAGAWVTARQVRRRRAARKAAEGAEHAGQAPDDSVEASDHP